MLLFLLLSLLTSYTGARLIVNNERGVALLMCERGSVMPYTIPPGSRCAQLLKRYLVSPEEEK